MTKEECAACKGTGKGNGGYRYSIRGEMCTVPMQEDGTPDGCINCNGRGYIMVPRHLLDYLASIGVKDRSEKSAFMHVEFRAAEWRDYNGEHAQKLPEDRIIAIEDHHDEQVRPARCCASCHFSVNCYDEEVQCFKRTIMVDGYECYTIRYQTDVCDEWYSPTLEAKA